MTADISTLFSNKVPPRFVDPDTGKVYPVSHLTQGKKGEFELWVKKQAMEVLKELREVLTKEEWLNELKGYREDCVAGRYFFHGEACERVRETIDGKLALAAMLFGCSTEEMIDLGRRHPQEVGNLINRVMAESGYARIDEQGEIQEGNESSPAPITAAG